MKILKTLDELEIGDPYTREMFSQFIEHYDFDQPKVYHQGETKEASEWDINWKEDIKFDESWNLYVPNYTITNFKDDSYTVEGHGFHRIQDYTYDTEKDYGEPTITYQQIKEWIESN